MQSVVCGQIRHHYLISSGNRDKPPLVLIHGFGMDKTNCWVPWCKSLSNDFRLIIPDVVGFGDAKATCVLFISHIHMQFARRPLMDFTPATQAERIAELMTTVLGAGQRFFVAGFSMGGHIAGLVAAKFPQRVVALGLIACHGVRANDSLLMQEVKATGCARVVVCFRCVL